MMKRGALVLFAVWVALGAAGCAKRNAATLAPAELEQQLAQKEREITTLESSVAELERDLSGKDAEIHAKAEAAAKAERLAEQARADAEKAAKAAKAAEETRVATSAKPGLELLPPDAQSGRCYARVFVPPVYRTETERVLESEASERIEISEARYEWAEERVLVKEASERIEVVPAVYDWKEERVLVKPATKRLEDVPAQFEWVEEEILVKPAHTVWKKGRGPIEKIDNATGEIMCLVEVPASYKTVKKRVLKTAATTREVEVPAEYKTVKTKVVVKPATTRKVTVPAEYETIKVRKLVQPAQATRVPVPAEYASVTKTAMVSDGRMEWRPVLCETNMTAGTITAIQRALQSAGHEPGPIDGIYGRRTRAAVRSYQQAHGLSTGGLTLKTIEKLGVRL